jgi:hypothetical protein
MTTFSSKYLLGAAALTAALATSTQAEAQTKRVTLNVLVLARGNDAGTAMVRAGLDEALVPYTVVDLTSGSRPQITKAFLEDAPGNNVRRAKFQAVVVPDELVNELSATEKAVLKTFETDFKIRQLDAYVYPNPAVNLNWPANPGYVGPLDNLRAAANATAKAAGFGYLAGPVPFDDLDPNVSESYGALTTVMPAAGGKSFTPFVEATIPGTSTNGVLLGVYNDGTREEMVITAAMNQYQLQQQLLFPGILDWLTYGVHLGTERNFLSVHIDDIFLGDARWSASNNCTVGDDCPATVTEPEILMTPADVDYLTAWQTRQGIKLDMVFNGFGYDDARANSKQAGIALGQKLISTRSSLRWINHTYSHLYLGCLKDYSVSPWRCTTNSSGVIQWETQTNLNTEISRNISFAQTNGISIDRSELVTGEHSGLRRAPQEPSDNPRLGAAFTTNNIRWAASDNSRETSQRAIGSALTVPRYPMNIYYNTGKKTEAVDEYNWIYNAAADGGSGLCASNPLSTCISPLDTATGFDTYIVPREARTTLLHMLGNSPRPHYAHESNLAEDRILYPVLDQTLSAYRSYFAANTPVVNPTQAQAGAEFQNRTVWSQNQPKVAGYVERGRVYLISSSTNDYNTYRVPATIPAAATGGGLGNYGGVKTGWATTSGRSILDILFGTPYYAGLPTSVLYPR